MVQGLGSGGIFSHIAAVSLDVVQLGDDHGHCLGISEGQTSHVMFGRVTSPK